MKKIIYLLALSKLSFALTIPQWQDMLNQFTISYGASHGSLINGEHTEKGFNAQFLNLDVAHIFDNHIYSDLNFNTITAYSQPNLGYLNGGNGSNSPFGQYPFASSLTGSIGYSISLLSKFNLIPYVLFGIREDFANSTILANAKNNLTLDNFLTGGLGLKANYAFDAQNYIYIDEQYIYNWDQSGAIKNVQSSPSLFGKTYAATNYNFVSNIGIKHIFENNLNIGLAGFWQNYQPQSNISGLIYTPVNTFGASLSFGFNF